MKQLLFSGILILVFNTNAFAQIPVINQKGTKILIDSSKWILSGSDIYNKNSGNVGLGNPSPAYKLDVTGKIRLTDSLVANSARIISLTSGTSADSIVVADPVTGILKRISINRLDKADSTSASNGLTLTGKDVRLGGALTGATTVTTSAANTLAISTLQSGTSNDSLVVTDATTGVLRRISSNRINKTDSTTASNGLTLTGKDVRLGGTLSAATTITNSGANTLRISGLTSGDLNDSLVVADPTTGELLRVSSSRLSKADSTTASNGLTLSGKDVRLGGTLASPTTITTSSTNTLTFAGLQAGAITDSILTINSSGLLRRININSYTSFVVKYADTAAMLSNYFHTGDTAAMLTNYVNAASNGLNKSGKTVKLGGTLTEATTIINSGANTLRVSGLTSGDLNDSLVVSDPVSGELLRISSNRINKTDSTTASNGITMTGKDIRLGGALTAATSITTTATNTIAMAGLQNGTINDSIVVADPTTGVLRRVNSSRINKADSTTASNGLTLTGKDVRLGGSLTAATTITTTATNTIAMVGLQNGSLNDSVIVADPVTGVLKRVSSSRLNVADSTTASNGITMTGKDIRLGGSLTAATTITTTAANTLSVAGLQSGSTNDSVLMITAGNIVRRINSSSISKEPFNVVGGSVQATTNTQDIYTQGNLSVGKTSNTATLEVGGKVKADSTVVAPNFATLYQTLSSGTVAWNQQLGSTATVTLTSNSTLTITNATQGMYGLLKVVQDGTGSRTLTLPAGSKVINGGGGVALLTTTANAVDILTYFYDGTNYWWTIGNNYN